MRTQFCGDADAMGIVQRLQLELCTLTIHIAHTRCECLRVYLAYWVS